MQMLHKRSHIMQFLLSCQKSVFLVCRQTPKILDKHITSPFRQYMFKHNSGTLSFVMSQRAVVYISWISNVEF